MAEKQASEETVLECYPGLQELVTQYLRLLALEITAAFHAAKAQHWTNINLVLKCLVFLYRRSRSFWSEKKQPNLRVSFWNFMYSCWSSKEHVLETMSEPFKKTYPSTRCIIDCTELFCQRPGSLSVQSSLYSNYKHRPCHLQSLVGIAPSGAVTFLSVNYTLVLRQIKKLFWNVVFWRKNCGKKMIQ